MTENPIELRHVIAGIISETEDPWQAALMINTAMEHFLLAGARHAAGAGCTHCGELVTEIVAARNTRDDEALDSATNELFSHMSLESDIAGDVPWLGGRG